MMPVSEHPAVGQHTLCTFMPRQSSSTTHSYRRKKAVVRILQAFTRPTLHAPFSGLICSPHIVVTGFCAKIPEPLPYSALINLNVKTG